jgi:hypothetical protein
LKRSILRGPRGEVHVGSISTTCKRTSTGCASGSTRSTRQARKPRPCCVRRATSIDSSSRSLGS